MECLLQNSKIEADSGFNKNITKLEGKRINVRVEMEVEPTEDSKTKKIKLKITATWGTQTKTETTDYEISVDCAKGDCVLSGDTEDDVWGVGNESPANPGAQPIALGVSY